jgi:hypothetical protein
LRTVLRPPSHPTSQRAKALLAGTDRDFTPSGISKRVIVRRLEAFNAMAALDLDSDGECVSGEDALDMLQLCPQLGVGWAR